MCANPRKPTSLKVLNGSFDQHPNRINPNEPIYETEIPDPPVELSGDALIEWNRITPILDSQGLISQINRGDLSQYCQLWGKWLNAERQLAITGEVVKDIVFNKSGQTMEVLRKSPWADLSLKYIRECRILASGFGMTPASAGKVSAKPKTDKQNKQARFFK
jgi:P27 family predicted phage terminase small subunit